MEEIASGKLSGSVQGDLFGDVNLVNLVPGKLGRALYVNGINQRVNLGNQRHNCMGDLSQCNNGFVMAMWIQMHANDGDKYYISSGGQTGTSIGVVMMMRDKKLIVWFRTSTRLWEVRYRRVVSLNTWYHVVLAWNIANGGKAYINGVLASHDQDGYSQTSNTQPNSYVNFMLGASNRDPNVNPGEMTLDELRIWDAVMDDQEILSLYVADAFPWNIGID